MKKRLILSLLMCGLLFSCNGKDVSNNSNTTNNDQQIDKSSDTEPSEPIQYEEDEQGLAFYPLEDGSYGVGVGRALFLENIVVPSKHNGKNVTNVINHGFDGDFYYDYEPQIKSITLPNTITEIGKQGIYCFESLETINLPKSLKKIGENGLDENYGLKEIHYEGTMDEFGQIDFGKSWLLTEGYNEGVDPTFKFTDKEILLSSTFDKLIISSDYENEKAVEEINIQYRIGSLSFYCLVLSSKLRNIHKRCFDEVTAVSANSDIVTCSVYEPYKQNYKYVIMFPIKAGSTTINISYGSLNTIITFNSLPEIAVTYQEAMQIIDELKENADIRGDYVCSNKYYLVECSVVGVYGSSMFVGDENDTVGTHLYGDDIDTTLSIGTNLKVSCKLGYHFYLNTYPFFDDCIITVI